MKDQEDQEPMNELPDEVKDMHRAVQTLMEQLDAASVYNQRSSICKDKRLKKVLAQHGQDEEKHASILLEWVREKENQLDVYSSPSPTVVSQSLT